MKFRVGNQPSITFNLPSKKREEGHIFVGKVLADIHGLKCSAIYEFEKNSLLKFKHQIEKLNVNLKGGATLSSYCNLFKVTLEASFTGNIIVNCSFKRSQFSQPYNINWSSNGEFSFEPSLLKNVIDGLDIES